MDESNFQCAMLGTWAEWFTQLMSGRRYAFTELEKNDDVQRALRCRDGAYVIWLCLPDNPVPMCLKIGKAQRRGGLLDRLREHGRSRQGPSPNILGLVPA